MEKTMKKALMSLFALSLIIGILHSQNNDSLKAINPNQAKMDEFIKQTGFTGSYSLTDDARIFSYLKGTFPFPEPNSADSLLKQFDSIILSIQSMYEVKGEPFILKSHMYNSKSYAEGCYKGSHGEMANEYYQYYRDAMLYDSNSGLGIVSIHYYPKQKKYGVTNKLFLAPVDLSTMKCDKDMAVSIALKKFPSIDVWPLGYLKATPSNTSQTGFEYHVTWEITLGKYSGMAYTIDGSTGEIISETSWIE